VSDSSLVDLDRTRYFIFFHQMAQMDSSQHHVARPLNYNVMRESIHLEQAFSEIT
jgi:hypothetical protein